MLTEDLNEATCINSFGGTTIKGLCPSGHTVKTFTKNPSEWYQKSPIKTYCPQCHRLVGVSYQERDNQNLKWYYYEQ